VISEESKERAETSVASRSYWLVDPLDGTKEFVKGTGEFTVNVALIEAGKPVLGVVHAPVLALTYYGLLQNGAWCRSGSSPAQRITSRNANPARLSVVASKDHAGPLVAAMLAGMPGASLRSIGSSLKFCLVADGSADLYLRDNPTMEWDTAAAQCVVEEAGGAIYELGGCPLTYGKADLRNPSVVAVGDPCFDWKSYLAR
jgi:3'(2'), 5'-bisphosphate nucleotidase